VSAHPSLARKRFIQFLLAVALLHVVAIAGYYALDVAQKPAAFQRLYAWIWMGATVVVIVLGLQRIKRARGRNVVRRPDGP
jgi:hypothetical protein